MARKIKVVQNKRCSVVYCKVVQIKSPVSQRFRGWRLVAIVPNNSKYNPKTDKYEPSFRPQYYVAWMGDFIKCPGNDVIRAFEKGLQTFPFFAAKIEWFE